MWVFTLRGGFAGHAALPGHFWAFQPVDLVLALSTVLGGYHYLIDAGGWGCARGAGNDTGVASRPACIAVAGRDRYFELGPGTIRSGMRRGAARYSRSRSSN